MERAGVNGTEVDLNAVRRVDLGCGTRTQKFRDCFGVDVNIDYQPDLIWDCDRGLPFADESLVFINADNSLEHFKHPYFVLQECHRCLQSGGTMRVVVPNVQYLPTLLLGLVYDIDRYFFWYMRLPRKRGRSVHYALFTPHLIRRMATEIGFAVRHSRGFLYSKEIALELQKT